MSTDRGPFELFARSTPHGFVQWEFEHDELQQLVGRPVVRGAKAFVEGLCYHLCQTLERTDYLGEHMSVQCDPFLASQLLMLRTDIESAVRECDDLLVAQLGIERVHSKKPEER